MGIDLLSAEVHLSEVTLCNKSVSTCLMPLFKNNIVGVESEVSNNSAQHEVPNIPSYSIYLETKYFHVVMVSFVCAFQINNEQISHSL